MPEFKEGDVVTHEQKFSFPGTYTVTKVNSYTVNAVGEDNSRTFVFTQEYLTKVTPEPYVPQVGDRVRLVVEGVVKPLEAGKFLIETEPGEGWRVYGKTDYTLELIEKAEAPVGTLVASGKALVFKTEKGWVRQDGSISVHGDRNFASLYNTVYEPPTS